MVQFPCRHGKTTRARPFPEPAYGAHKGRDLDIESLWERSIPLLDDPPPVKPYAPGTWGPNAIHQLIAPHAWRLPFERGWRQSR